jgi:type II secretory pathway pseudopilin PulG
MHGALAVVNGGLSIMSRSPIRPAVTLIELIVVIGILLILAALLLPAIAKVRQAAERTQSTNNLKQLGLSFHNYADAYRAVPPMAGKINNQEGSAIFHLLPFIEQDNVFKSAKGNSWNVAGTVIPVLLDPQDQSLAGHLYQGALATTNYAGNYLVFKDGTNRFPAAFTDGTSNTIMFTTRYQLCNGTPTVWAYPTLHTWTPMYAYYSLAKFQVSPKQDECDPHLPQSIGPVILAGLCDGSVRSVDSGLSPRTWHAATTPSGGEVLDADW